MTTKVLVVDDEAAICELFAALLNQYGCYQVVTTTDGRKVMDLLRRERFDVVLMDMRMPAITGGFCPTPQKGTFQHYAPLMARSDFV